MDGHPGCHCPGRALLVAQRRQYPDDAGIAGLDRRIAGRLCAARSAIRAKPIHNRRIAQVASIENARIAVDGQAAVCPRHGRSLSAHVAIVVRSNRRVTMLKWFDSKEVDKFADWLASEIIRRYPPT